MKKVLHDRLAEKLIAGTRDGRYQWQLGGGAGSMVLFVGDTRFCLYEGEKSLTMHRHTCSHIGRLGHTKWFRFNELWGLVYEQIKTRLSDDEMAEAVIADLDAVE